MPIIRKYVAMEHMEDEDNNKLKLIFLFFTLSGKNEQRQGKNNLIIHKRVNEFVVVSQENPPATFIAFHCDVCRKKIEN